MVSSAIPVVSTSSWDIRWSRTDVGTRSEEKLKENPYDVDDWGVLINEAKLENIDRARVLYERLVQRFPTSGRYWRIYIEHEVYMSAYFLLVVKSRCVFPGDSKVVSVSVDVWISEFIRECGVFSEHHRIPGLHLYTDIYNCSKVVQG